MPAKNSGMRFLVIYGPLADGRARFNLEDDARWFARAVSIRDHSPSRLYDKKFLSRYEAGERFDPNGSTSY